MDFRQAAPLLGEFAFRSASDGRPVFEGYAAVFDSPSKPITDILGVNYVETLKPGAFKRTLTSGRRQTFVVDHLDSQLISATNSGRLRLGEDSKGLHVESDWISTDYANNVRALYEAGESLGMSFTYRPTRTGDSWNAQRSHHTVTDTILGHVTVLTWKEPAYNDTVAAFRALAEKTTTDAEDIAELVDALREGRLLDDGQRNLLTKLAEASATVGETPAAPETSALDPDLRAKYAQVFAEPQP